MVKTIFDIGIVRDITARNGKEIFLSILRLRVNLGFTFDFV